MRANPSQPTPKPCMCVWIERSNRREERMRVEEKRE